MISSAWNKFVKKLGWKNILYLNIGKTTYALYTFYTDYSLFNAYQNSEFKKLIESVNIFYWKRNILLT